MTSRFSRFADRVRIPSETNTVVVAPDGSIRFANEDEQATGLDITASRDMLPVPRDSPLRTWGVPSVMGFFVAEAFSISQYQVGASAVTAGLSPAATIGAILLGHVIISIAAASSAWVGAFYGINFPSYGRTAYGIRGTYLVVVVRAIAAIVWFGTQTYQGGQCVSVMLAAIWPSFKTFPNHLPVSAHVTSSQLLCFFIFYIVQLPFLWIHISKLRYLFMVKIVLMPIFGIVLFGWAVGSAGGFGPTLSKGTHIVDGRPAAVVFFSAMSSAIAPKATLALNLADFSRYSKSPKHVVWANIFSLSVLITLAGILGVVVTSAVQVIYDKTTWNPLQVSSLMDNRAAQFFSAFCWAIAALATNISANSTAVGNDLMVIFPTWISVRRGQFVCAILGLVTCPWIIQSTAKTFTSFLSGYSVFLAPAGGVLIAEVFFVRGRKIWLPDLYTTTGSAYWYSHGVNVRAMIAFSLGCIPSLPGFIRTINPKIPIPIAATYVTSVVYPVGLVTAGTIHFALSKAFPPAPLPTTWSTTADAATDDEEGIDDKEKDLGTSGISTVPF